MDDEYGHAERRSVQLALDPRYLRGSLCRRLFALLYGFYPVHRAGHIIRLTLSHHSHLTTTRACCGGARKERLLLGRRLSYAVLSLTPSE